MDNLTNCSTISSYDIPTAFAESGKRLVGVIPGNVFTSKITGTFFSDKIKSTLEYVSQPSA